jgi:hypothetical protein
MTIPLILYILYSIAIFAAAWYCLFYYPNAPRLKNSDFCITSARLYQWIKPPPLIVKNDNLRFIEDFDSFAELFKDEKMSEWTFKGTGYPLIANMNEKIMVGTEKFDKLFER